MSGSRLQALLCPPTELDTSSSNTASLDHGKRAIGLQSRPTPVASGAAVPGVGGNLPVAGLVSVIEADIIPRLLLMHRVCQAPSASPGPSGGGATRIRRRSARAVSDKITAKEVADLLELVRHDAVDAGLRYVHALRHQGHGDEQIFKQLLAPVARQLGEMWTADEVSFIEVTLAVARVQRILFELCQPAEAAAMGALSVLMTAVPGEQHTLGLHMAAATLTRAGVNVVTLVPVTLREIEVAVRASRFDLVGFSLGSESLADSLASVIEATRVAAHQTDLKVIVGGPAAVLSGVSATRLGADHVVRDVAEALALLVSDHAEQNC